jgi:DNA-binding LacI/PurR family transcriptional regulator
MTETPSAPTKRPTIAAVARAAGVSTSAVSHVFNGRPNVSAETAARIMRAADDLNWRPNLASRRVAGAAVRSLGLIIVQATGSFQKDPFYVRLLSGLTPPLAKIGWSLSVTVVDIDDEDAVYRQWWNEQRVDGFILIDLRENDSRVALLERLGAPAVLLGAPIAGDRVPAVTLADADVIDELLDHLGALGHTHIARVTEQVSLAHVGVRNARFTDAAAARGMTAEVLHWNGAAADPVYKLLHARGRVSALVFDSEVFATQVVARAPELGFHVPTDVSVVSWEDSWVSDLVRPRLTALDAPIEQSTQIAVDLMARLVKGDLAASVLVPGRRLVVRDSTGPAPLR